MTNYFHGRSQGKSFTGANMLNTSLVWYVVEVVYGDLKSCPHLIYAGGASIPGGCNSVAAVLLFLKQSHSHNII